MNSKFCIHEICTIRFMECFEVVRLHVDEYVSEK